eukprot:TRINITY_DN20337_c0_g1_i1.p2 TRINITY_DN20337_c0_g1~~TRINITY_DN20337_c0_g1_i1.p2  ORF type:complete len:352 (+),score=42.09 TRINITY_DN20337_c0_g1_i1:1151-2206(+)
MPPPFEGPVLPWRAFPFGDNLALISSRDVRLHAAILITFRYRFCVVAKRVRLTTRTVYDFRGEPQRGLHDAHPGTGSALRFSGMNFGVDGGDVFNAGDPREICEMLVTYGKTTLRAETFGNVMEGDILQYDIYDDGVDWGFRLTHWSERRLIPAHLRTPRFGLTVDVAVERTSVVDALLQLPRALATLPQELMRFLNLPESPGTGNPVETTGEEQQGEGDEHGQTPQAENKAAAQAEEGREPAAPQLHEGKPPQVDLATPASPRPSPGLQREPSSCSTPPTRQRLSQPRVTGLPPPHVYVMRGRLADGPRSFPIVLSLMDGTGTWPPNTSDGPLEYEYLRVVRQYVPGCPF